MGLKYIFKLSKVNGNTYLQIFQGTSTADMKYIRSAGSPKKLVKSLELADKYLELTKKYPGLLTKLQEQKSWELTKK
jgi:hypothetical protein